MNQAKVNHGGREDRISSLPDEVLTRILSLLSTRDAFRTTLLSSRWENLWAWVPNLSFSPLDGRTEGWTEFSDLDYMKFIDMRLLLHNSSIHKFYLETSPQIDKSRISAWISTLVKRNVRDITIYEFYTDDDYTNLWLPRSLFNCKTLERLKLGRRIDFNVPPSVHFPRLKILHVSLNAPSKELTEKLFCSCPVLEDLKFQVYSDSGRSYNISSPALKNLSIKIHARKLEDYDSVVVIDAPVLQELKVYDECCRRFILKRVPFLGKASVGFEIFAHYRESLGYKPQVMELYRLLTAISGVKNLFLECCSMQALGLAIEKKWPVFPNLTHLRLEVNDDKRFKSKHLSRWPTFPNLRHLHLNVNDDFGSKRLSHLLTWAPNLASLVFEKEPPTEPFPEVFDPSEQQGVLACLQSNLKEVEVLKLEGSQSELLLIKYLLKSARVLETLTVEHCKFEELSREEFQMEILAMPRCSKLCEVVFI